MNIKSIRQDFPLLQESLGNKPIIYLDNACQSLRPQSVINAITDYYRRYSACGGRSMHRLAETVTQKCDETRRTVARFINAKRKEEIVFTRNTTEGINLIAHSLGFRQGDIVIISDKEHNSNLIPWQVLKRKIGIEYKIAPTKENNTFDLEAFRGLMNERVKLVSLGFTSNLDGMTIPASDVIKIAHGVGSLVLLDAAQTVPHHKIDVQALDVDFLAFSGHKMLAPSGTGVLYGKYRLLEKLDPFLAGGDTVSSSTYESHEFLPPPEKFEAGLQDYAGIIGLGEAVRYLETVGFETITRQEQVLNKFITDEIVNIPKLKIIGDQNPNLRSGIISFYIKGVDSHQIAIMLDQSVNIMVRSGQHCVHSWFASRKIAGSVRASLYFYNTLEEVDIFVKSLKKVLRVLN
ncbi:MAG: cysteine desulfurase [Patescibacteria group bacterium]|nr:cysteine desulfurase [Patescibacteria group bacterium]MCL5095777.1 cysteine desulfurase [Patescibacteria group bacterium]